MTMASKKQKSSSKTPPPRTNNLTLGLPGGKPTPPATIKRKTVVRTGRDQRIKRTFDSPGGPV
jgi:hypothetical protein